jgi:hypothetical protein
MLREETEAQHPEQELPAAPRTRRRSGKLRCVFCVGLAASSAAYSTVMLRSAGASMRLVTRCWRGLALDNRLSLCLAAAWNAGGRPRLAL